MTSDSSELKLLLLVPPLLQSIISPPKTVSHFASLLVTYLYHVEFVEILFGGHIKNDFLQEVCNLHGKILQSSFKVVGSDYTIDYHMILIYNILFGCYSIIFKLLLSEYSCVQNHFFDV